LVYAIAGSKIDHRGILDAIDEMADVVTGEQLHIAVQVMAKSWTTQYWISPGRKDVKVLDKPADASRATALTAFIDQADKTFPGARTALLLRAHATGLDNIHSYPSKPEDGLGGELTQVRSSPTMAIPMQEPERPEPYGCRWGPDPNTNRFLTNVAMKKAIAASRRGGVDLLGLNACWMATLEIEYELRHVAAVEVASQVYAKPWPYRAIVESLSRHPEQSAEELGRSIVASVRADIAAGRREDAVSAFRAGAAMDDLTRAFDIYAKRVTQLIDTDWPAVRDAVMTRVQRIDDPHQVDLVSLTKVLGSWDPAAKAAGSEFRIKFQSMRLGNAAHPAHPGVNGLSIFCPKSTRVDLTAAYRGTEFRSNSWGRFLAEFQRTMERAGALDAARNQLAELIATCARRWS
jgi:hypothetical protein